MWKPAALRVRRRSALAEMVQSADRAGSYTEPWARTPRVWEAYDSQGDMLRDLHLQWRTELAGAIFVSIEQGHGDLASDVGTAYAEVVARLGGVKRILDAHADHPAIAAAVSKERALLAAVGSALAGAA